MHVAIKLGSCGFFDLIMPAGNGHHLASHEGFSFFYLRALVWISIHAHRPVHVSIACLGKPIPSQWKRCLTLRAGWAFKTDLARETSSPRLHVAVEGEPTELFYVCTLHNIISTIDY